MIETCASFLAWLARDEYANLALGLVFLFGAVWVVLKTGKERVL